MIEHAPNWGHGAHCIEPPFRSFLCQAAKGSPIALVIEVVVSGWQIPHFIEAAYEIGPVAKKEKFVTDIIDVAVAEDGSKFLVAAIVREAHSINHLSQAEHVGVNNLAFTVILNRKTPAEDVMK